MGIKYLVERKFNMEPEKKKKWMISPPPKKVFSEGLFQVPVGFRVYSGGLKSGQEKHGIVINGNVWCGCLTIFWVLFVAFATDSRD